MNIKKNIKLKSVILIIFSILVISLLFYFFKNYKNNNLIPIETEKENPSTFDINEKNIFNNTQENKTDNSVTINTKNQNTIVKIITEDQNRKDLFNDFNEDNLNISISNLSKIETDIFSFYVPKDTTVKKMKPDINNPLSDCDVSIVNKDKDMGVIILLKSCVSRFGEYLGSTDVGFEKDGYAIIASYNVPLEEINNLKLLELKELYQSIKKTFSLNSNIRMINVFWGFNWSTIEGCPSHMINPISRYISNDKNEAYSAVEELIKGPTSAESYAHFWSGFSKNFTIKSFDIKKGVATVELSTSLNVESDAWKDGSCGKEVAKKQLYYTLGQFPYIEKIIYIINGKQQTEYPDMISSTYRL